MADYAHHRCTTCRHAWSRPQTREEPADGGCNRETELGMLYQIRLTRGETPGRCDEWGTMADCPLWESRRMAVCPHHGLHALDDGCDSCLFEHVADSGWETPN